MNVYDLIGTALNEAVERAPNERMRKMAELTRDMGAVLLKFLNSPKDARFDPEQVKDYLAAIGRATSFLAGLAVAVTTPGPMEGAERDKFMEFFAKMIRKDADNVGMILRKTLEDGLGVSFASAESTSAAFDRIKAMMTGEINATKH